MAVGFGHSSESHTGTTGAASVASYTWNHDTTGDRCIVVFVLALANMSITGESVTVGGTSAAIVPGPGTSGNADARDTLTEPASVRAWFLDNIPQGASTAIVVNRTNNATVFYSAAASFTASGACQATGAVILNDDGAIAEQNVDDGSPGTDSMRCAGAYTGDLNPPAAGANSTLLQSIAFGARSFTMVRETTAGQGSRAVGCTAPSDDRAVVALAVRELPVAPIPDVVMAPGVNP